MTLPRLRHRFLPILAILIGSPVCAEYLSAYLESTGDVLAMAGALVLFAPLYGAGALLIREIAVRARMGWPGLLLLAAVFGVAMPCLVDLSAFGPDRPDVPYWEAMRASTLLPELGVAAFPVLAWSLGHVVMSVGVPIALTEVLSRRTRGTPLLGRIGIPLAAVAWVAAMVATHRHESDFYGLDVTRSQLLVVASVLILLLALALSPLGRPIEPQGDRPLPAPLLVLIGGVGLLALDFLPATWVGVAMVVAWLSVMVVLGVVTARRRGLPPASVGALAAGAVVARTFTGFLSPLPPGVDAAAKLTQNVLFLALALAFAALVVWRGAAASDASAAPGT